ncbi:hypothetical protein [Flavobacterium sp. FlaQc-50]|uniref:hypothetical protein n=1 Tax=unclassified Flavobacterium TaxID=196869 RepID=UPI0037578A7A
MLLNFPEQIIDDFIIPAFTINEGEIIIIEILGGAKFRNLTLKLNSIFTNQNSSFKYVEHIQTDSLLSFIFPLTVEKYLKNSGSIIFYRNKIYELNWMKPKIKVNTLAGSPRRILSLYKTLTFTKNIIIDLVGVDPIGGVEIYQILKSNKNKNGATILFDSCNEFENDCSKFIRTKYIGE